MHSLDWLSGGINPSPAWSNEASELPKRPKSFADDVRPRAVERDQALRCSGLDLVCGTPPKEECVGFGNSQLLVHERGHTNGLSD